MVHTAKYSFDELIDMLVLVYGETDHNVAAASHLSAERYLQRWHPDRRIFVSVERFL
jgi:hypothetical protein